MTDVDAAAVLAPLAGRAKVPSEHARVYKDECAYSFDTSESEAGLFVCMETFLGLSREFVTEYHAKTGRSLFLHIKTFKKEVKAEEDGDEQPRKITKMAIGVEGGFDVDKPKFEYEHQYSLAVLPGFVSIPLHAPGIPDQIQLSAAAIIAAESAATKDTAAPWVEQRLPSKHAEDLVQLDNGVSVPPSGWKCANCDITDNLWLNLSDGSILCGRRQYDGSGGNNHAVEHYAECKFPLAVKLGTITPEGADVFSYPEDDLVTDPHIDKHLAHWGIKVQEMKKTALTMTELQVALNERAKAESECIEESGQKLEPLSGPGYTGLRNLGNTCYLNSVCQALFSLPEFKERFFDPRKEIFAASGSSPAEDLEVQLAKLADGLLSGKYSQETELDGEQDGIQPRMFKTLIGKDHPEFSTNRQQDALEFFQHMLSKVERSSRAASRNDVSKLFRFTLEERIECTGQVKYTTQPGTEVFVPVDLTAAVNKEEVAAYEARVAAREAEIKESEAKAATLPKEPVIRPKIPFETGLQQAFAPEVVADYRKPGTVATKTMRFATFPKYLVFVISKFYTDTDWSPKKKDVSMEAPLELDLTRFQGKGLQPDETEMPEEEAAAPAPVEINEDIVTQLAGMGFAYEGCRRAAYNCPQSVDAAMEWVLAHMGDPDFSEPFVPGAAAGAGGSGTPAAADDGVSEESIAMVQSMGFSRDHAVKALKKTGGAVDRAVDWMFSHMDELDTMETEEDAPAAEEGSTGSGSGKYKLKAVISHIGASTGSGHYVAHIRKGEDGKFAIFNDRRVARSVAPPLDLGYLYLYESV